MRKKFLDLTAVVTCVLALFVINSVNKYLHNSQDIKLYNSQDTKTISLESIEVVKPIIKKVKRLKEPVDYSKLTWQEVIEHIQTPEQAQDYVDRHFSKKFDDRDNKGESFKENHLDRNAICFGEGGSCAATLSDNGYPPLILCLYDKDKILESHGFFLYKTKEGYGNLGIKAGNIKIRYKNIEDLIMSYTIRQYSYFDDKGDLIPPKTNFSHYYIINLDENYPNKEWISGDLKEMQHHCLTLNSIETIKGNYNLREIIEKRIAEEDAKKNNQ